MLKHPVTLQDGEIQFSPVSVLALTSKGMKLRKLQAYREQLPKGKPLTTLNGSGGSKPTHLSHLNANGTTHCRAYINEKPCINSTLDYVRPKCSPSFIDMIKKALLAKGLNAGWCLRRQELYS